MKTCSIHGSFLFNYLLIRYDEGKVIYGWMIVYETINMKLPIFTLHFLSYLFRSKDLILILTSVRIRMIYCYND